MINKAGVFHEEAGRKNVGGKLLVYVCILGTDPLLHLNTIIFT